VHGLDLGAIDPRERPCSQEWLIHEAKRWLESHTVPEPPPGGIAVEVGYRMLRVDDDGRLHERLDPVTRGTGTLRW
jgi:hypothetical protein